MRARLAAALILGGLAAGCTPDAQLAPDPSRLAPWTTELRDTQPDGPFALVYSAAGMQLIYIAAIHENERDSPTFRLIEAAYALWPVNAVVLEGVASGLPADDPRLLAIAARPGGAAGFDPDGETGPAVRGALGTGARLYGGELDDLAVRDHVRRAGIEDADLLGFYVLRMVPQWLREGAIANLADPRLGELVQRQLSHSRDLLQLPAEQMRDLAAFRAWYARTNGKALAAGLAEDELGPLADGRWPTNRISAAVAVARDAHLLVVIAERLQAERSVLVVFGASHASIARPALDAMLGAPCYVGPDLDRARALCSAVGSD